ncbi:MAG: Holliday junction resolvase RuvX [Candidatus Doudnabacteria bacterium CG10_big_fil_rev_8_21_14_0_10_41_10]|uniref:Putative pre-16S rRNA nuclease n=1 Tax=Candidatus Doudnabacteria bacterium CG10_big_fil_rev_8_21_14_0_10_41_10 TaxID=1974551 RepID=A0A2H0VE04_9BACT|nr:MAG: Holliday junction resolvase RuvX [Candidatus Doudnabacteria bacterium CG10_big_fil_rev_8_21_14_0_10_41_10]
MPRILALDWGSRRIGVSISDELKIFAQTPISPLQNNNQVFKNLERLVIEYEIEKVLLGLPKSMSGEKNASYEKVEDFGERLYEKLGLRAEFLDERLSTVEARKSLQIQGLSARQQKDLIDNRVAQLLLQQYLDRNYKSDTNIEEINE